MPDWLITGCSELLTLRGTVPRRGRALSDLGIIRDGALLVHDDRIAAVGQRRHIERLRAARRAEKLDLGGRVVLPGFVDSHTHLIFPASRADEYEQRISGKTYEQIAKDGGGIRATVKACGAHRQRRSRPAPTPISANSPRTAPPRSKPRAATDSTGKARRKSLIFSQQLHQDQPLDIVRTFLGAHIVPPEFRARPEAFVDLLVKRWIPTVATAGLADFCDAFCDRGAFTVAQSRRIFAAGRACGLVPRIHAEQLAHTGAARLAIEVSAASADHLEKIDANDIRALALSNVVCTLLPGCGFHLGTGCYAPARKLIDAGAIVALATDFNPGTSPTLSMPMILSLACSQMRITPAEAISSATINPAYSLRQQDRIGSLEADKYADLAAFDVASYREIPYYFGVNLCKMTMKRGVVIHSNKN